MKRLLASTMILMALGSWGSAIAQPKTCTARDALCRNECVTNHRNGGGCNRTCDQRRSDCMSTGCWGNASTSRCGFQKS